jgi:hypothetical protein
MKKKLVVLFCIASLMLIAGKSFSQAAVSHSAQQDIEVSVPGKGGPTLIKQGETRELSFVPISGSVNFLVRYKVGRKYEARPIQLTVVDGAVNIPEPPGANREEKKTQQQVVVKDVPRTPNKTSGGGPGEGKISSTRNITAPVPSFTVKATNKTSKGELFFIGKAFNGIALKEGDSVISSQDDIKPGLVEFTVLYRVLYSSGGEAGGQVLTFAQQALVYIVTEEKNEITITDNDFFNLEAIGKNAKFRFKNVGHETLYSAFGGKKFEPLEHNRVSKKINFSNAMSMTWYAFDDHNTQRVVIYQVLPGRKPLINIRFLDTIYNVVR